MKDLERTEFGQTNKDHIQLVTQIIMNQSKTHDDFTSSEQKSGTDQIGIYKSEIPESTIPESEIQKSEIHLSEYQPETDNRIKQKAPSEKNPETKNSENNSILEQICDPKSFKIDIEKDSLRPKNRSPTRKAVVFVRQKVYDEAAAASFIEHSVSTSNKHVEQSNWEQTTTLSSRRKSDTENQILTEHSDELGLVQSKTNQKKVGDCETVDIIRGRSTYTSEIDHIGNGLSKHINNQNSNVVDMDLSGEFVDSAVRPIQLRLNKMKRARTLNDNERD